MDRQFDPREARLRARIARLRSTNLPAQKASRTVAIGLGLMVMTIYGYSMYAVKQETIFAEIDNEIGKS